MFTCWNCCPSVDFLTMRHKLVMMIYGQHSLYFCGELPYTFIGILKKKTSGVQGGVLTCSLVRCPVTGGIFFIPESISPKNAFLFTRKHTEETMFLKLTDKCNNTILLRYFAKFGFTLEKLRAIVPGLFFSTEGRNPTNPGESNGQLISLFN